MLSPVLALALAAQSFALAAPPLAPVPPTRITVAAVGDVLLHGALQRQAAQSPDGFTSLWREVAPRLAQADVAYANLEGPVAQGLVAGGREVPDPGPVYDARVYTTYPLFNYPPRLLADLVATGIDVVSTANNHALDRGSLGVDRTMAALQAQGMPFTGTRPADGTGEWFTLTPVRGVQLAWVACSFSTNGIPDRHGQVLDCHRQREVLLDLVRTLHARADIAAVLVTPHWGVEYAAQPHAQDTQLGRDLIEAGAVAVLGAHPHVPQPWEVVRTADGRQGLLVHSLGNFVSGQFHRVPTRASVLAELDLEVRPDGKAIWSQARYVPLEMKRTARGLEVVPIADGTGTPAMVAYLRRVVGDWETPWVPHP